MERLCFAVSMQSFLLLVGAVPGWLGQAMRLALEVAATLTLVVEPWSPLRLQVEVMRPTIEVLEAWSEFELAPAAICQMRQQKVPVLLSGV